MNAAVCCGELCESEARGEGAGAKSQVGLKGLKERRQARGEDSVGSPAAKINFECCPETGGAADNGRHLLVITLTAF